MITQDAIRQNFPALAGECYLNTAAESIPPIAVGAALQEYWEHKQLGMDGRDFHFGREAAARENAARLLGLSAEEVGFCSCSAEAYNLLATALRLKNDSEVVLTDLDFPSGATPWLAGPTKSKIQLWKSRVGELQLADLLPLLTAETQLVQVSLVSFYNGWRIAWDPFIKLVREKAPRAIVSVDVTQALGRCILDCRDADIIISSTHKWLLGIHGGCIVAVPARAAERLTTAAGGWYHIGNAFGEDRFEVVDIKPGAASYSVGMPSFAPIYALNAAIEFLLQVGVDAIAAQANPLVHRIHEGLLERGIEPLATLSGSGIVAFKHARSEAIHEKLRSQHIHIMHQAGRLRVALHGYNTSENVDQFLAALDRAVSSK